MLKNHPRADAVIARLWSAVGIKSTDLPDDTVGDLLDEWKEALGDFALTDISKGVDYWKEREGTPSPDMFVGSIVLPPDKPMTPTQVVDKANQLAADTDMTFDEAYETLGLHKRWGPHERKDA